MKTIVLVLLIAVGCGGDNNSVKQDAGAKDAGMDTAPDASCFENPTTHHEIINACTTAQKIYKSTKPPLQNADGTLPSLPP
jgi:hypothetical protein